MKTKLIDNIFELVSCDNDSFYELSRAPLAYQYFRNTFKNIKNGDFLPEIFEEDCSSFKWFGLVETDKVSLETSSVLSNAFEMFSNNMIQYCIFLGFELLYEIHKKSYNKQSVINGMFYYAEMEIPLRHLYVKCLIGLDTSARCSFRAKRCTKRPTSFREVKK